MHSLLHAKVFIKTQNLSGNSDYYVSDILLKGKSHPRQRMAKYISTANTDAVRKSECRQLGRETDLES
jgi:hypothetical protein